MKVKEVFEKSLQFLRDRKIESPRLETELLMAFVLKTDRVGIYLRFEAPLSPSETDELRSLIVRKSKGEPTSYLLGEKYFYDRRFEVGPGVLIPRPETEQMIDFVIENLSHFDGFDTDQGISPSPSTFWFSDWGSGSGCIGITLALELMKLKPHWNWKGQLYEKSELAYQFLLQNREKLLPDTIKSQLEIFNSSVEDKVGHEPVHLIVANPPYIDPNDLDICKFVKKYEPCEALFASNKGLAVIENWMTVAIQSLVPRGCLFFEIGHQQGNQTLDLFRRSGAFSDVMILKDFSKRDRFIKAVKNG